jgi:hypothetical protein
VASVKIPNPIERRHLLERPMDPAQALRYADAYLAEDRAIEAVEFLAKAEATDRLEEVAEAAIAAGDAFLFRQANDALRREPGADRWLRLAAAAESAGLTQYAQTAHRIAEVDEDA